MRWFKHLTDASDDEFLIALEHDLGLEGYARWWKLCEAIGKRLKKTDPVARLALPVSKWVALLKCKPMVLLRFVERLANDGRITFEHSGNVLIITLPKLLKYRDEYSKKSGHSIDDDTDTVGAQNTEYRSTEDRGKDLEPKKTSSSRRRSRADQVFAEDSSELKAARYLFAKIRANNPKAKEPNWQTWAKTFDLIFRIDERGHQDVRRSIDFAQSDSFWLQNILSPKALRKHFDRLLLRQAHAPPAKTSAIAAGPSLHDE